MREFSPARQTFTAAVTKPSPDHDLKVPEKKAKYSDCLFAEEAAKKIFHGGCGPFLLEGFCGL